MKILMVILACLVLAVPALAENSAGVNSAAEVLVWTAMENQKSVLSNQVMILQNQVSILQNQADMRRDLDGIKNKLNKRKLQHKDPSQWAQKETEKHKALLQKEIEKQKAIEKSLKSWVKPTKGKP
jgi:hypothetical protein